MSDLSAPQPPQDPRQRLAQAARSRPYVPRDPGGLKNRQATTWWQDTFYALGKPEELTVKAIGNLFSDDPKYDFGTESNYHDQQGFVTLAHDAGIENAFLALGVGMLASVANPLDPTNKIRIGAKTMKGQLADMAKLAEQASSWTVKDGFRVLNTAKLQKRADELKAISETADLGRKAKKVAKREAQSVEAALKESDSINEALVKFQTAGGNVDELKEAKGWVERAREGQIRLLGLSNPFSMEHIPLARRGTQFDRASRSLSTLGISDKSLVPGADALHGAVVKMGSKATDVLRDAAKSLGASINQHLPFTGKFYMDEMNQTLEAAFKARLGDNQLSALERNERLTGLARQVAKEAKDKGLTPNQVDEMLQGVFERLEDGDTRITDPELRFVKERVARAPEYDVDIEPVLDLPDNTAAKLNDEQFEVLSGFRPIDDRDTEIAMRSWRTQGMKPLKLEGFDAKITDKHVTLADQSGAKIRNTVDPEKFQGIYGVANFRKVEQGGTEFLAANKLPGGKRVWHPNDVSGAGERMNQSHLANLEIIAAQLADRGLAMASLDPSDFLVNELGGIQLINPAKIIELPGKRKADRVRRARMENSATLAEFASRSRTAHDPSYGFVHLSSNAATRRASSMAKNLYSVRGTRATPIEMKDGSTLYRANAARLLDAAVNTNYHKQFVAGAFDGLSEAEMASIYRDSETFGAVLQGIQNEVGRAPWDAQDIRVAARPDGSIEIVSGRDALAAAVINGVDSVRVRADPVVTETFEPGGGMLLGTKMTGDVFYGDPGELATANMADIDIAEGVVAQNYKLVSRDGVVRVPSREGLRSDVDPISQVAEMLSRQPRTGKSSKAQSHIISVIAQRWPDRGVANQRLAEMAHQSQDLRQFLGVLSQETGVSPRLFGHLLHPNLVDVIQEQFENQIRRISGNHLTQVAANGIFSDYMLRAGMSDLWSGAVETFDQATNTYRVSDPSRTIDELRQLAKERLTAVVSADEFMPFSAVELVAGATTQRIRIGDLVEVSKRAPAKATYRFKLKEKPPKIPQWRVNELKAQGILINPPKGSIPHTAGALIYRAEDGSVQRVRSPFFTDDLNNFVLGTRDKHAGNVESLVGDFYQEGFNHVETFGVIASDGVDVNYPVFGVMASLDKASVAEMEAKIRMVASRVLEQGISEKMPFRVHLPFEHHVLDKMGLDGLTLGGAASKDFKIKLPKELKNTPLDSVIKAPNYVARVEAPRYLPGSLEDKLHEGLRRELDEIYVEDAEKFAKEAMPYEWNAKYVPRILNPALVDAQKTMNKAADKFFRQFQKTFKVMARSMKDRVITDLTTVEVNNLIRQARKGNTEGLEEADILKGIVVQARKMSVSGEIPAGSFYNMAKMMDEAGLGFSEGFFVENPILATAARVTDSFRERTKVDFVRTLKESGAALVITKAGMQSYVDSVKNLGEIKNGIAQLEAQVQIGEDLLRRAEALGDAGAVDAAKAREILEKFKPELDKQMMRLADANEAAAKFGPHFGEAGIGDDLMWIPASTAKRLYRESAIDDADILSRSIDQPLVAVPASKVLSKLGDSDEVIHFPKSVMPLVEKYFSTYKHDGFSKALRYHDAVMAFVKSWLLFPMPKYHVRNAVTNTVLGWIGGVDPSAYGEAGKAFTVLRKLKAGTEDMESAYRLLDEMVVHDPIGNSVTMRQLYHEWVKQGGPSAGMFHSEFSGASSEISNIIATSTGVQKSSTSVGQILNAPVRAGQKTAEFIEDHFRFGAFIDTYRKTGDMSQGGQRMKEIFYDYRDLTPFERNVMRRVIPFYAWMRKNTPAMLKAFVTRPDIHYKMDRWARGVIYNTTDGQPLDDSEYPEWVKRSFGVVVDRDKDGNFSAVILGSVVPTYDALNILTDPLRAAATGLTPFLKVPYEQISNTSLLHGGPLSSYSGQIANDPLWGNLGITKAATMEGPWGPLGILMNQHNIESFFGPAKEWKRIATSTVDAVFDPDTYGAKGSPLMALTIDVMLGRMAVFDPEKASRLIYSNWERKEAGLKRAIKNADDYNKQRLTEQLRLLQLRRPPQ